MLSFADLEFSTLTQDDVRELIAQLIRRDAADIGQSASRHPEVVRQALTDLSSVIKAVATVAPNTKPHQHRMWDQAHDYLKSILVKTSVEDRQPSLQPQGLSATPALEDLFTKIVEPTLALLSQNQLEAAVRDLQAAKTAYQSGNFNASLEACGKTIESALNGIAAAKKWRFSETDRASDLIRIVAASGVFPGEIVNAFYGCLTIGIYPIRYRDGNSSLPNYIAAYALDMVANTIAAALHALGTARLPKPTR